MLQLTKKDINELDSIVNKIEASNAKNKNYAEFYEKLNKIAQDRGENSIASYFYLAAGINGNTGESAEVIRKFLKMQGLSEEQIQKMSNDFAKELYKYIKANNGRIRGAGELFGLDKRFFREHSPKKLHSLDFGSYIDPKTGDVVYIGFDDYLHYIFILMDNINSEFSKGYVKRYIKKSLEEKYQETYLKLLKMIDSIMKDLEAIYQNPLNVYIVALNHAIETDSHIPSLDDFIPSGTDFLPFRKEYKKIDKFLNKIFNFPTVPANSVPYLSSTSSVLSQ